MSKHKKTVCPCGSGYNVCTRGRCQICYMRIYRLVREGKLTWAQAEKRGIVMRAHEKITPEMMGRPYAKR